MDKEEKIVNILNNKYQNKLKKINNLYFNYSKKLNINKFRKLQKKQNKLIIKIIKKTLKYYKELNVCDFVILNGSFASNDNIYDSDIDLNIMYKDIYKDSILKKELNIYYILSKVLNFKGCDRIHSIMLHVNDYDLKLNNINSKYFYRDFNKKTFLETINSSRDYKKLLFYISNTMSYLSYEKWFFNFCLLKDYGGYNNFKKGISKLKLEMNKDNKNIDNLINELKKDINIYDKNGDIFISKLKEKYKTNILMVLYKTKEILKFSNNDCKIINNFITTSLWFLTRIKFVLKKFDKDLSSHSKDVIKKDLFLEIYQNLYHDNFDELFNNLKKDIIVYLEWVRDSNV